ncbi:MAG: DnaD domain protein [Clostridiaceae bacterium]|nr:DnaD domain protein [Clostridiaceae bacterium]
MEFKATQDMLFSDTGVPDIFIYDYMPSLPSECVKVYVYGLFLCKNNKSAKLDEIAVKLGLSLDTLNAALVFLENENLLVRTPSGITFTDIKAREIDRLYRRKETSPPSEAISNTQFNQNRNRCIESLNQMFFSGLMPGEWYTFIDNLFKQHRFNEDVMVALFQYCKNRDAMNRNYVGQVAANWAEKNITSHLELEKYMEAYQKTREIGNKIAKALRLNKSLSIYEEEYVNKWTEQYGYDMDVIELALKMTVGKKLSFRYIDSILTNWFKEGLKTKEQIMSWSSKKAPSAKAEAAASRIPQRSNFKQREYNNEFYEKIRKSSLK